MAGAYLVLSFLIERLFFPKPLQFTALFSETETSSAVFCLFPKPSEPLVFPILFPDPHFVVLPGGNFSAHTKNVSKMADMTLLVFVPKICEFVGVLSIAPGLAG